MKIHIKIFIFVLLFFSVLNISYANPVINDGSSKIEIPYGGEDYGIEKGVTEVGENVEGLVTDQTASDYFQSIIIYLLGFIYLIAVSIIIYSGFNILTGLGDEEKVKKSKTIISYTIIGIIIIFLASTFVQFVFDTLNDDHTETGYIDNIV